MPRVYFDLSMSLDGLVTGPNPSVEQPLGRDGERLHDWMFGGGKTEADAEVLDEVYSRTGAIVIGKSMFDVGVKPWGDPPPFRMPVFVITHEPREPMPMKGGTTYTFVTDGLEAALERAKSAAGEGDVGIWGGAYVVGQYLQAGLLDEFEIHLVPILLGDGVRLFEDLESDPIGLEPTRAIPTPSATHLRFDVKR
jgi:dihydrofolate reductase